MSLPLRVIGQISGKPHMIDPGKADEIMHALTTHQPAPHAGLDWEAGAKRVLENARAYRVERGMSMIPIDGTLVHQWESIRPESGSTGYDGLRVSILQARADDAVDVEGYQINSPGGMVSGLEEIAALIAKSTKPTVAYIDATCQSAAYYLASQCDYIVCTPSGQVGSIGAAIVHLDRSKENASRGHTYTVIAEGPRKYKGSSIEPLDETTLSEWRAEIKAMQSQFADAVGAGRGVRFTAEQAMATESRTYSAPVALEMGMIDAIAAPEDALDVIFQLLGNTPDTAEETGRMAVDKTGQAAQPTAKGGAQQTAEENAADILAKAQAEAAALVAAAKEDAAATRAEGARQATIAALDVPQNVKDVLAGAGFESVAAEDIGALVATLPKSSLQTMEAAGGAGVEADPEDFAPKTEATEKAERKAAAEERLKLKGATV